MTDREKVIKGLECCCIHVNCAADGGCPYRSETHENCLDTAIKDALALLKAQEPRVMTLEDFENNPSVDQYGCLPCWMEYREEPKWDGWAEATVHTCVEHGRRPWTSRPTDEQREAEKWK